VLEDGCKEEFVVRYQKHLEDSDRDGRTAHWLIDDEGVIVGVMTVRIVQKEPSPSKERGSWGYLTNSFVMPERRNRGLGTQLLRSIRSWAIDLGLELLIVWPSEASYPFYRRAGFKGRDDPLELLLNADDG
jgi:GNAT superfamily N-acetyltransferase